MIPSVLNLVPNLATAEGGVDAFLWIRENAICFAAKRFTQINPKRDSRSGRISRWRNTDWCWILILPDCQQVINGLTSGEALKFQKAFCQSWAFTSFAKSWQAVWTFSSRFCGESLSNVLVCPFERDTTGSPFPAEIYLYFSLFLALSMNFASKLQRISEHDRVFIILTIISTRGFF